MAAQITAFDELRGGGQSLCRSASSIMVSMTNLRSMVKNVKTAAAGMPIMRLTIVAGEAATGSAIQIGSDRITLASIVGFASSLRSLRGMFSVGGVIHIASSRAVRNRALLSKFAELTGVSVVGGTGRHMESKGGAGFLLVKAVKAPVFREAGVPVAFRHLKGLTA